jgi:hypothetical protein
MRRASYVIPAASGDTEDGDLSVSEAGGALDANIDRWAGQFGGATPKKKTTTFAGKRTTLVELRGSYTGMGMLGAPGKKDGFAMLAAIVETDPPTFFKLVGPERTINGAKSEFEALMASLKAP